MTMNPQTGDPLIDDVRRVKREISAEFDHDPAKLIAYLTEYQKQFADRLSHPPLEDSRTNSAD